MDSTSTATVAFFQSVSSQHCDIVDRSLRLYSLREPCLSVAAKVKVSIYIYIYIYSLKMLAGSGSSITGAASASTTGADSASTAGAD